MSPLRRRPLAPLALAALALTLADLAPGAARAQQAAGRATTARSAPQRGDSARARAKGTAGTASSAASAASATGSRKKAAGSTKKARPLTARERMEAEIRSAASKVRAAMVIQDTSTLATLWADEYRFTSLSGETYSKSERLESVMSPSFVVDEAAEVLPSEMDIIRFYGNVAVVNSRLGPPGTKRSGSRGGRTQLLTVWVREKAGKWRTVASQATGVTASMPSAGRR